MSEVNYLILEFLDADGNNYQLSLKHPKEDLSLETVTAAMNTIISDQVLTTADGTALTTINSCYYKTVTLTPLEGEGGE